MRWKSGNFPRPRGLAILVGTIALALPRGAARADEKPAPIADERTAIEAQIERLGSPDYLVRERAERELSRYGASAFDALLNAERHRDLEVAARAGYLARGIRVEWMRNDDPPDVKKVMREYGEANGTERANAIGQLSQLPLGSGWEALCRIVRFERTPELSKRAALLLLSHNRDDEFWRKRAERLTELLGPSERPAADWLRTRARPPDEADEQIAAWDRHLAREFQDQLIGASDGLSDTILTLTRQKFAILVRLQRRPEALAAVRELMTHELGEPERLLELLNWLIEEKAWDLIDEFARRFDADLTENVMLLYRLAEAHLLRGNPAGAEEVVARARTLNPKRLDLHLVAAYDLQRRGLVDWSVGEFRRAIEIGPPRAYYCTLAYVRLASLCHDQGRELEAAQTLEQLLQVAAKDLEVVKLIARVSDDGVDALRGNMEYYWSLHEHAQGNFDKELVHLKRAYESDNHNPDILIAMHRYSRADAEFRLLTSGAIDRCAKFYRTEIAKNPDDPNSYNVLSWLIANTGGDADEAIRLSHKSLELAPNIASYLDTLAHAYYAKGDFANAVKYQTQAVELEPNMGLLTKQLKVFQAALDKADLENGTDKGEPSPPGQSPPGQTPPDPTP